MSYMSYVGTDSIFTCNITNFIPFYKAGSEVVSHVILLGEIGHMGRA